MAHRFDAQSYLHQLAQRAIEDPEQAAGFPRGLRVVAAARALCSIGVIDPDTAQGIVNEPLDRLQSMLETSSARAERHAAASASMTTPVISLLPPRPEGRPESVTVRECSSELPFPWGRLYLHYAVFFAGHVSVEATAVGDTGKMKELTPAHITDDQGTSTSARFQFSGTQGAVRGPLLTERPLSAETRFLEVAGFHVELRDPGHHAGFSESPMGPSDPAERHLWLLASMFYAGQLDMRLDEHLEPAAEALICAGALMSDSNLFGQLRSLGRGFDREALPNLGEPWKSLVGRWGQRSTTGLFGSVPLGDRSPEFDGFVVRVDGLVAHDEGFDVRVDTSPATPFSLMRSGDATVPPIVVWWARDDLGNYYSGRPGSGWRMGPGFSQGPVSYRPLLDPKARTVELMPVAASTGMALPVNLPWVD